MDDDGPTASIIIFFVLLFVDMFFYGFGAAITALNTKEIERRAQEDKDKRSLRLEKIIGTHERAGNPAAQTLQNGEEDEKGVYY